MNSLYKLEMDKRRADAIKILDSADSAETKEDAVVKEPEFSHTIYSNTRRGSYRRNKELRKEREKERENLEDLKKVLWEEYEAEERRKAREKARKRVERENRERDAILRRKRQREGTWIQDEMERKVVERNEAAAEKREETDRFVQLTKEREERAQATS